MRIFIYSFFPSNKGLLLIFLFIITFFKQMIQLLQTVKTDHELVKYRKIFMHVLIDKCVSGDYINFLRFFSFQQHFYTI